MNLRSMLVFAIGGILGAVGCSSGGDGPQRYDLSGTVTFDGKPVPFGDIIFAPDSSAGNKGPQGYAPIENGAYTTKNGKGVVGGPHSVRISGREQAGGAGEESQDTSLFVDYEVKESLPKENATKNFEVSASAARRKR